MESNEKMYTSGCAGQALIPIKVQEYGSTELSLNIVFSSRWKDGFCILFKARVSCIWKLL